MNSIWAAGTKNAGVGVLFGLCGAWSQNQFPQGADHMSPYFALPFGVLCWLLCSRGLLGILSAVASMVVYSVAWWSAGALGFGLNIPIGGFYFLPTCVGGLVGGAGLALMFGIVRPRLLSRWLRVAAVGAVAALPFGSWLTMHVRCLNGVEEPQQPIRLLWSFAIWQAAVGTYLYAICAWDAERAQPSAREGGPV